MVKIRLARMGTKARPFYRMVVAKSTEPRNGKFVEILGTYNPVAKPVHMSIREERALHWLMQGAQPSETAAIVLNKVGVLDKYFEARPNAKKSFKFLDKRTAAMSVKSVIETPAAAPAKPEPAPEPVATTPAVEEAPADDVSRAPEEETTSPAEAPVAAADSGDDAPAAAEAPAEEAPAAEEEKPE